MPLPFRWSPLCAYQTQEEWLDLGLENVPSRWFTHIADLLVLLLAASSRYRLCLRSSPCRPLQRLPGLLPLHGDWCPRDTGRLTLQSHRVTSTFSGSEGGTRTSSLREDCPSHTAHRADGMRCSRRPFSERTIDHTPITHIEFCTYSLCMLQCLTTSCKWHLFSKDNTVVNHYC